MCNIIIMYERVSNSGQKENPDRILARWSAALGINTHCSGCTVRQFVVKLVVAVLQDVRIVSKAGIHPALCLILHIAREYSVKVPNS